MCLLACYAGIGFSAISSNPIASACKRKVQEATRVSHKPHPRVREGRTKFTPVHIARRFSPGVARQGFPQQLTCIGVCSYPAATCACHSPSARAANICGGGVAAACSLAKPFTTLTMALAASLLLLTVQPSMAEALQVQTAASAALQQHDCVTRQNVETFVLADSSKAAFTDQNDPVNPFTLFGTTRKQFLIENLQGTKVMSRKKGFTTTTCVSGVAIGQQTKRFEALPESAKSNAADNQLCSKTTGPDLVQTCNASCAQACTAALSEYADRDSRLTGYSIDAKTKDKLAKSCIKQCTYECAKPGDRYGFAIPYRSRE